MKQMIATIFNTDTGREKNVRFGALGYQDFTQHKDEYRKDAYLN